MAERDTSFLFSGTSFNREKFSSVFSRFKVFQEKKGNDSSSSSSIAAEPNLIGDGSSAFQEVEEGVKTQIVSKKRKRKAVDSDPVEGFSVFKSSKFQKANEDDQQAEHEILQGKKEYYRQLERDAIFRKKHNIHVSGSNVPSPLQSFGELKSRFNSKSYILRNLAELGFAEPTPIQRGGNALHVLPLVLVKHLPSSVLN